MIVILHIEKTGICSIEHSLNRAGLTVWNGCQINTFGDSLPLNHNESINSLENMGINVYCSHFDKYFNNFDIVPESIACTVIRNPVSRTLSHISYLYEHINDPYMVDQPIVSKVIRDLCNDPNNLKMWIKAFEIMPYLSNLQTFRLKCSNSKEAIEKINKMLIVEPFERLNIFYDRLCSHFGVQYPLLHLNTCSFKLDVSENIKTWIKEKNTMDMVLWNYCLNIKKNY